MVREDMKTKKPYEIFDMIGGTSTGGYVLYANSLRTLLTSQLDRDYARSPKNGHRRVHLYIKKPDWNHFRRRCVGRVGERLPWGPGLFVDFCKKDLL